MVCLHCTADFPPPLPPPPSSPPPPLLLVCARPLRKKSTSTQVIFFFKLPCVCVLQSFFLPLLSFSLFHSFTHSLTHFLSIFDNSSHGGRASCLRSLLFIRVRRRFRPVTRPATPFYFTPSLARSQSTNFYLLVPVPRHSLVLFLSLLEIDQRTMRQSYFSFIHVILQTKLL